MTNSIRVMEVKDTDWFGKVEVDDGEPSHQTEIRPSSFDLCRLCGRVLPEGPDQNCFHTRYVQLD